MNTTRDLVTNELADFIAGRRRQSRYQMRAVIRLLGRAIGRTVTVSDLIDANAEEHLRAFLKSKLYQASTARGYVTALRQLQRAATGPVDAGTDTSSPR